MANAQQPQSATSRGVRLPGEDLTLAETLRVMDVAREMRDQRVTAEKMFERDGIRASMREKLLRQAAVLNEDVTEAEIDAAIDQYLEKLHRYEDPKPSFGSFIAHCWVWRNRILWGLAGAAGALAGAYYFFL